MTSLTVAVLLAVALVVNFVSLALTMLCFDKSVLGVTERNILSFFPRGVGGDGPAGRSPLFGAFWATIYALTFASIFVFGFVDGCTPHVETAGVLLAVALLLAACWQPLFLIERPWSFATSAVVLFVVVVLSVASVALADPFRSIESVSYLYTFGICVSILAGWASIALTIGTGLTIRVYSRGLSARPLDNERSLLPLILAIALAVTSTMLVNPMICTPLIIASCFIPGILFDWSIYTAFLVACAGHGFALMRMWVG